MNLYFPHAFTAEIVHHYVGSERYRYTVIFVPDEIKAALPLDRFPKLRVTGEVDEHPIEAALTPVRGAHYVAVKEAADRDRQRALRGRRNAVPDRGSGCGRRA